MSLEIVPLLFLLVLKNSVQQKKERKAEKETQGNCRWTASDVLAQSINQVLKNTFRRILELRDSIHVLVSMAAKGAGEGADRKVPGEPSS